MGFFCFFILSATTMIGIRLMGKGEDMGSYGTWSDVEARLEVMVIFWYFDLTIGIFKFKNRNSLKFIIIVLCYSIFFLKISIEE